MWREWKRIFFKLCEIKERRNSLPHTKREVNCITKQLSCVNLDNLESRWKLKNCRAGVRITHVLHVLLIKDLLLHIRLKLTLENIFFRSFFCWSLATVVKTVHPQEIDMEMAAMPIPEHPLWMRTVSPGWSLAFCIKL